MRIVLWYLLVFLLVEGNVTLKAPKFAPLCSYFLLESQLHGTIKQTELCTTLERLLFCIWDLYSGGIRLRKNLTSSSLWLKKNDFLQFQQNNHIHLCFGLENFTISFISFYVKNSTFISFQSPITNQRQILGEWTWTSSWIYCNTMI